MDSGPVRDRLLDAVHRRALHLARLTAPGHPGRSVDVVLAHTARSLLVTCLAVLGEALVREWSQYVFGTLLEAHDVCRFCASGALVKAQGMCDACFGSVRSAEQELAQAEAMEQPDTGQRH